MYILYAISNGFFIFYAANYLQTISLEYMSITKFMPITYMCTVFVFILGFTLLGENIFLTDIIGAGLIIFFQLYNFYYPPSRQISENGFEENEKISSINKLDNDFNEFNNVDKSNINDNNKNEKLIVAQ